MPAERPDLLVRRQQAPQTRTTASIRVPLPRSEWRLRCTNTTTSSAVKVREIVSRLRCLRCALEFVATPGFPWRLQIVEISSAFSNYVENSTFQGYDVVQAFLADMPYQLVCLHLRRPLMTQNGNGPPSIGWNFRDCALHHAPSIGLPPPLVGKCLCHRHGGAIFVPGARSEFRSQVCSRPT